MCLLLRYTERRGRSVVPNTFLRTCRRRRVSRFAFSTFLSAIFHQLRRRRGCSKPQLIQPVSVTTRMPGAEAPGFVSSLLRGAGAGNGLAGLDLDDFAFVSDALALVGLGLADAAHVAGELSDEL